MSRDFRLNLTQDDDASGELKVSGASRYEAPANIRTLAFVWPDGRTKFLNYGYMISGEFDPADGIIKLEFTSDDVVIRGIELGDLFADIRLHIPKDLTSTDTRYNDLAENNKWIINEIICTPKR